MAIIQDWKIRGTNARCELTGEEFVDEQDFFTCIFDDPESDGFIRRDYSVESWRKVRGEIDPAPFSFWRSTYKAPVVEEEEDALRDTSAEGMLRRFIEQDDPTTENARYILALMLERKKTLIPTDRQETETRTLLFYEHADNGDVFIVADPGLKLDEIESVQRDVAALLAAEEAGETVAKTPGEGEAAEETAEPEGETAADADDASEAPAADSEEAAAGNASEAVGESVLEEENDPQEDAPEQGREKTSEAE